MKPLTYPARPVNGGALPGAPAKAGTWFYEPKYNGWRGVLHVPSGALFNRQGVRLSIEREFTQAIAELQELNAQICRLDWLDVEALERRHGFGRGVLIVLDLLDAATQPFRIRANLRADLFHAAPLDPRDWPARLDRPHVYQPPLLPDPLAAWDELHAINRKLGTGQPVPFYEGVVAKRADSIYPIQLRNPGEEFPYWVKHRWTF